MPKIHLLYFKNLLDLAFSKFFELYNDKFIKSNGKYILSQNISQIQITKIFRNTIIQALKEFIVPYDILKPNYFIILGECMPNDNILLSIQNDCYFPAKLNNLIHSKYKVKYLLNEKDIRIDIILFNQVCSHVFDEFFAKNNINRLLGKNYNNVVFITHNKLDCYLIFNIIRKIYGKHNCINLHDYYFNSTKSPIIAINDLIEKYTKNKKLLNVNAEFNLAIHELATFLKTKLQIQ